MSNTKMIWFLILILLGEAYTAEGWADPVPIVAVIDTGADIHHSMLRDQLWTNPGESGTDAKGRDKAKNNIDDDGNGYIDDVHGWNFLANNNDIADHLGHGTHVSGIIIAKSRRGAKAPVEIMVLKFFDSGATGDKVMEATAQAVDYATKMGASIINYSAGGRTSSLREFQALVRARDAKVLVVTAAGNEHTDNDKIPFYPANYNLTNIISVAATDEQGVLLPSSNFGKISVQARANGKDIWSALPGERIGKMTGTSQATAMITARILLERSQKRSWASVMPTTTRLPQKLQNFREPLARISSSKQIKK